MYSRLDNCLEPVPGSGRHLDYVISQLGPLPLLVLLISLHVTFCAGITVLHWLACRAAGYMDMDTDTRFNAGPVQTTSGRPEEVRPSDPAAFIQDLANKVCDRLSSQDASLS